MNLSHSVAPGSERRTLPKGIPYTRFRSLVLHNLEAMLGKSHKHEANRFVEKYQHEMAGTWERALTIGRFFMFANKTAVWILDQEGLRA
jgi:hypothetical protein